MCPGRSHDDEKTDFEVVGGIGAVFSLRSVSRREAVKMESTAVLGNTGPMSWEEVAAN